MPFPNSLLKSGMGILPMMDSQEKHGLEGRATSFFNGLLVS